MTAQAQADVTSVVDEICAQSAWTAGALLKLRSAARNHLSEGRQLQTCYAALEGEQIPAQEKALREAALAWILRRPEQADAALKIASGPLCDVIRGGLAFDREQYDQAAVSLRSAAQSLPKEPSVAVELALALCMGDKVEEAEKVLAKLQGLKSADLSFVKGRICEKQGRQEASCALYEEAVQQDDRHAEAAFRLAYYMDLRGEDRKAVELYKKVTGQGPAFVSAMINLGLLLEDMDQMEDAINCFKESLRVDPTNRRASLYLRDTIESLDMYYDETERKENERLDAVLRISISDFELSVRSRNCLAKMNVRVIGDVVRRTEHELLAFKNFGETSLTEIKNLLSSKGLRLGMFKEEEAKKARAMRIKTGGTENSLMLKPITDLELSVRSRKCMQRLNIESIGELVEKTEAELLAIKNFGQTSLNELKAKLAELDLGLKPVE